jgi:hypothetical protein
VWLAGWWRHHGGFPTRLRAELGIMHEVNPHPVTSARRNACRSSHKLPVIVVWRQPKIGTCQQMLLTPEYQLSWKCVKRFPVWYTRTGRHDEANKAHLWNFYFRIRRKLNLKYVGFEDVDWIHLAQDRVWWRTLVSTAMNLRAPLNGRDGGI